LCLFPFGCLLAAPSPALNPIGGGTCSAANLSGAYALTLSARGISPAGSFAGTAQAVGTATFDGVSNVSFTGVVNTNQAAGSPLSSSGTYSLASNCYGPINFAVGSTATYSLVVWNGGKNFAITGSDGNYVYSGSGTNVWPAGCANAALSGAYSFSASGSTLSGTAQTGSADEAGVFQFDGRGNVTASYRDSTAGVSPIAISATGTYSVTSACTASATLADSTGRTNTMNMVLTGNYGANVDLMLANSQFLRSGSAHSALLNPTQSIGNVFSYAVNSTPAGSAFVLYGTDLATRAAQAGSVPFPTTLLTTKVTVNGEAAPLFYVSPDQIDALLPWDIPGGAVASVVVQNGTAESNAAAIYVPATGTPGIAIYGSNHAVVTNSDGITVNSAATPAKPGDEVVAWFTGGGPVNAAGSLVSGAPAPSGLSPITGTYSVTVGTATAEVKYIGLTPGSIGLYQVNFVVPQLAKGSYAVQIDIAGQFSNKPVISVGN
jgi:uncharacterized protein (TIGR03437 family)